MTDNAERRSLEARLHEDMLDIYEQVGALTGYWANYFLRDLKKHGGLVIARKLLNAPVVSSGFERLKKERILHLSVEAVVLGPKFAPLFTLDELDRARRRLTENGYTPDDLAANEEPIPDALIALLDRALAAVDQMDRWDLRDEVVRFGAAAREAMRGWLAEERLPAFALSVLERLAAKDPAAARVIDSYAALGGREQVLARAALDRIRRR